MVQNEEDFITESNIIHNNKYDYSLVNYINSRTKVKIICKKHGVFEQTPNNHLRGQECPECYGNKKLTKEKFILKSNIIHNNKYDYSLVKYKNAKTKVKIICNKHGVFEKTPDNHISKKQGCPICHNIDTGNRCRKTKEKFISDSINIHGYKYDYSLVEYKNGNTKVKIICEKHGVFNQAPKHHLYGAGCPKCNNSKGEIIIEKYLLDNNINYTEQKKFNNCKYKKLLPFDFYLFDYNICIEYDGEQHYKPKKHFGGEETFKMQCIRDNIKTQFCNNNNIKLIRIKYNDNVEEKIQYLINNIF
jgi:very-short-patch-repair endonuclease